MARTDCVEIHEDERVLETVGNSPLDIGDEMLNIGEAICMNEFDALEREKCRNFEAVFSFIRSCSRSFSTLVDSNAVCIWKLYSSIASHSRYAFNVSVRVSESDDEFDAGDSESFGDSSFL